MIDLKLKRTVLIFLYDMNGSRSYYHVPEHPNGFGDYRSAWTWINNARWRGVKLPLGVNPVEIYHPPERIPPCSYSQEGQVSESSLMAMS